MGPVDGGMPMIARILIICAVGLLLTGCQSGKMLTTIPGGEAKVFEAPPYAVRGVTKYDQGWIDSQVEGGVAAFGWPRPAARPASLDKHPAVRPVPAPKKRGIIKRIKDSAQNFLEGVVSINVAMTKEETCIASQYGVGDGYHGRRTAVGRTVQHLRLTAAHRTRRFGSHVTVTNKANGRSVRVRITDRGPFIKGRCIDLSRAAANAIGMGGTARVNVVPVIEDIDQAVNRVDGASRAGLDILAEQGAGLFDTLDQVIDILPLTHRSLTSFVRLRQTGSFFREW
jgi:rare lipoprotein A